MRVHSQVRQFFLLSIMSLLGLLVACNGDSEMDQLKDDVKMIKQRKRGVIEPAPEFEQYSQFSYPEKKRRSPFKPLSKRLTTMAGPGVRPNLKRAKEPLESYPLDALRMVGTLRQSNRIWAMVGTTDGRVYRITVGNHVGKNFGRVDKISSAGIALTETVRDGSGWRHRPASMALVKREQ